MCEMFSRKPPRAPKKTVSAAVATDKTTSLQPQYVAQGTYGCVMRPAASCNGSTIPNAISKIFNSQESQEEEVAFQNRIEQLDPNGEYTVKKLQECSINANLIPKSELSKCENLDPNSPYFWQIIYEYGGDDLQHVFKDKKINVTFEDIFQGMGGILKGLVRLNEQHLVHQDIKPANILFNNANTKCYLIDFGLLTNTDSVYDADKQYIITYNYDYYPPEFKFFSSMTDESFDWEDIYQNKNYIPDIYNDKKDESSMTMLQKYIEFVISNYTQFHSRVLSGKRAHYENKYSKVLNNALSLVSYWHPKNLKDIRDFTKTILKNRSSNDIQRHLSNVANKIDVYMLGITMIEVFVKLEDLGRVNMKDEQFIYDVFKWIHGLICFNPFQRYTPQEALKQYQQILSRRETRGIQTKIPKSVYQKIRNMPDEPIPTGMKQKSTNISKNLPKRSKMNSAPARHSAFIKKQLETLRSFRRSPYNLRSRKNR